MAANGQAYLTSGKEQDKRYINWFGARDAGREATVNKHFAAIKDAFETKPVKVDCACDEDYFAYVYPAQPYTIWVCNAFWSAPLTGTDSKGGTLVHEMGNSMSWPVPTTTCTDSKRLPKWHARRRNVRSATPIPTITSAKTRRH